MSVKLPRSLHIFLVSNLIRTALFLCILLFFSAANTFAYEAGYYGFQTPGQLPANPNSIVMRATQVDVPAGAVFSLHLMKGSQLVSSSRTVFTSAYKNLSLFTGTAIATFRPLGTSEAPGDNFPGAKLYVGTADLSAIAASPDSYTLFWELSEGFLAPKDRLLATAAAAFSFVDLKLNSIAAAMRQSDQKPGSVLFYHRYVSGFSRQGNNTTLHLTNTSPVDSAKVRVFFISNSDCQAYEQAVCLAPNQSTSFLMSEIDPGVSGYCIAFACDAEGKPTQFNWLIGNAQLRQTSSLTNQLYDTSLAANAVTKHSTGSVAVNNNKGEMIFDDKDYDRLPAQLAADNVPNQTTTGAGANATILNIYRPTGDLSGATVNPRIDFLAFSNAANSATSSQTIGCYGDLRLTNLRFSTALNTLIPAGRTGWLKVGANDGGALFGAQFNSGSYTSGTSLRPLTYANDYRILVPIKTPGC